MKFSLHVVFVTLIPGYHCKQTENMMIQCLKNLELDMLISYELI